MNYSTNPFFQARLALMALNLVLWVIAWHTPYFAPRAKNSLVKRIVKITYILLAAAIIAFEPRLYRSISGIDGNLKYDNVFMWMYMAGYIGALIFTIMGLLVYRRRIYGVRHTSGGL